MSAEPYLPVSTVRLGDDVEQSVLAVLRSGMLAQGPVVAQLEQSFADMVGARHCIAVNNGTTALIAALAVLDLQPGDEVLTSPFTFVATLNAVLAAGANVRFADIGEADFCLDPVAVAAAITPATRVLMPVHLYGQCADMDALVPLAERAGLHLVEDAAQAHGATLHGRHAGTWGLGCFSLYATKNLTSGEGGLITTDDDALADRLRVLRNQGMRQRYQYEMVGYNYRLTDLQAAVCVPQLVSYGAQVERRRHNAERLSTALSGVPGVRTPQALPGRGHVWHQYTVVLDDTAGVGRDELAARLHERGIGSGAYYPGLVFDHDCFRGHPSVAAAEVPVARSIAARCLSLPVHPHLSDGDVDRIAAAVGEVLT